MSDLPRHIRARLDAAHGARPTTADRARIRAKLDAQLIAIAAGAVVASAAATTATAASAGTASAGTVTAPAAAVTQQVIAASAKVGWFGFLPKVGLSIFLIGVVGFGARSLVTTHASVPAPASSQAIEQVIPVGDVVAIAPSASAAGSADAVVDAVAAASADAVASADASADASSRVPQAAPRSTGNSRSETASIAAEVALLRRAQTALKDGHGDASLRAIDALDATHPNGALREERSAARVLALCAAGRDDDARAEADRFLSQWPASAQAARVRASCAFSAPAKK